jgi:hypothetical protein
MNEEAGLLLRGGLAALGLWYALSVLRRRRLIARDSQNPPHSRSDGDKALRASSSRSPRDPDAVAARWEELRTWAARVAIGLLIAMGGSVLLATPYWLTAGLLGGIGVSVAVYLVSSVASGWYEGKASTRR